MTERPCTHISRSVEAFFVCLLLLTACGSDLADETSAADTASEPTVPAIERGSVDAHVDSPGINAEVDLSDDGPTHPLSVLACFKDGEIMTIDEGLDEGGPRYLPTAFEVAERFMLEATRPDWQGQWEGLRLEKGSDAEPHPEDLGRIGRAKFELVDPAGVAQGLVDVVKNTEGWSLREASVCTDRDPVGEGPYPPDIECAGRAGIAQFDRTSATADAPTIAELLQRLGDTNDLTLLPGYDPANTSPTLAMADADGSVQAIVAVSQSVDGGWYVRQIFSCVN